MRDSGDASSSTPDDETKNGSKARDRFAPPPRRITKLVLVGGIFFMQKYARNTVFLTQVVQAFSFLLRINFGRKNAQFDACRGNWIY